MPLPPRPQRITSKPASSGLHIALKHMAAGDQEGRAYLGSPETVDGLIRVLIAGILDRFEAVTKVPAGEADKARADAVAADKAEMRRYAKIFTGQDAAYETVGTWNTGGELAKWVRARLAPYMVAGDTGDEDTLMQAFAVLGIEVYGALSQYITDANDENAKDRLDTLADDWTQLLLGIAPTNTYGHGGTEVAS